MCLVGEQLKKSTTCNIYRRGGCLCTPHWMWLHHEYSSTNSKPNITDILTPQSVTFAFLLQNMVVEDVGKSGTTSVSQTYLHPTLQGCNMLVQFVCCFFFGGGAPQILSHMNWEIQVHFDHPKDSFPLLIQAHQALVISSVISPILLTKKAAFFIRWKTWCRLLLLSPVAVLSQISPDKPGGSK